MTYYVQVFMKNIGCPRLEYRWRWKMFLKKIYTHWMIIKLVFIKIYFIFQIEENLRTEFNTWLQADDSFLSGTPNKAKQWNRNHQKIFRFVFLFSGCPQFINRCRFCNLNFIKYSHTKMLWCKVWWIRSVFNCISPSSTKSHQGGSLYYSSWVGMSHIARNKTLHL